MASRRAATNKYVTVRCSMSADDQPDIGALFVKTGKIGGFVRSRKSGVLEHFGELCHKESDNIVVVPRNRRP